MQARRLLQRTRYSLRLLVKNAVFVHRVNNVYWTTCIIRHACAVRINYQKGLGPSINTTDPLNFKFQDWCSTIACFWSYVLPKQCPSVSMVRQFYLLVLLDSIPYLFCKATVGKISTALGISTPAAGTPAFHKHSVVQVLQNSICGRDLVEQ